MNTEMNTDILTKAVENIKFDRALVFHFFVSFSLFEKALKSSGFRKRSNNGVIEANWKDFSNRINDLFIEVLENSNNQKLVNAINYLYEQPPNRQVINYGIISFDPLQRKMGTNDTEWLSILIRQVRNNLFHGVKFSYDSDHDSALIRSSLEILECWANLDENVNLVLRTII